MSAGHWSTQQLVEFLAVVSSSADEETAIRAAVERAAEALDAELGALGRNGALSVTIGVPADEELEAAMLALAEGSVSTAQTAQGAFHGMAVALEWPPSSRLV